MEPTPPHCPNCQSSPRPGDLFCASCGLRLSDPHDNPEAARNDPETRLRSRLFLLGLLLVPGANLAILAQPTPLSLSLFYAHGGIVAMVMTGCAFLPVWPMKKWLDPRRVRGADLAWTIPAMAAMIALLLAMVSAVVNFHYPLGYGTFDIDLADLDNRLPLALEGSAILVLAFVEELLFRGALADVLQRNVAPRFANFAQAFLFAAMHMRIGAFPILLALGWILGWTTARTRSLWPAILLHFLWNSALWFHPGG